MLQAAHTPIQGRNDEVEAERAYDLLQRAYEVGGEQDKNLKLRIDLLSETISRPLSTRVGKRYLEKSLGSGAEGLALADLDLANSYN